MLSQIQDVLNVYLFPFVIAVPIAVVLYLLVTRRDELPLSDRPTSRLPDADSRLPAATEPAAARPPASAAAAPMGRQAHAQGAPLSTLEAAALLARPPQEIDRAPAPASASSKLLLVDDSAVARAKLRKLFETAGYPVDLAKDGLEALELLARNRYALMITDLEMPQMDGVELIAAVHGSLDTENLPIIAITGHDDLQAKVHECEGLFGLFKKPWNDRELLRRVETLVRLQSAPGRATA
jgi:CheY-like chemotaxis protein